MVYKMRKNDIKKIYNTKFIRLYQYDFSDGKQYFWASRRNQDRLVASMGDEDFKKMLADAVSCFVDPVTLNFTIWVATCTPYASVAVTVAT